MKKYKVYGYDYHEEEYSVIVKAESEEKAREMVEDDFYYGTIYAVEIKRGGGMKRYKVSVDGCDDSTVVEMKLNELELDFLKRFSKLVNETSTYGCMPTIDLEEVK